MPDWMGLVRERLAALRMTAAAESGLAEEVAQHLEEKYRELRSGGASDGEAQRKAVAELDDLYPLAASVEHRDRLPRHDAVPAGDTRPARFFADFGRDLRYAARSMRKSPAFVAFVLVTLALGIGANTTVFTVINTLILNPLPVRDASSLVALAATDRSDTERSGALFPLSLADVKDYREKNEVFEALAGYTSARVITWHETEAQQRLFTELVTGNYFATLGLEPAKGRFFLPEEDAEAGAHAVAVMNYGTWQTRFGGAEDIVGRTLRLNNIIFTIVGVAPAKFIGVNGIFGPDVWIPSAMAEQLLPNEMHNALNDRTKAVFQGVGRLRPGVGQAQAQANAATIAAALARAYTVDEGHTAAVRPVRDVIFGNSFPGSTLVFAGVALLAVVGIVLLIACSNVANLLLARSAARQKEMAVRLAMGASRRRLVRQLLTESVLLGTLAGVLGLAVAYAGLRVLFGLLPGSANFVTPRMDAPVFGFSLAISLVTGLLFGTIPAFQASRAAVAESLKEAARTAGRSRRRITVANGLLVVQVAFSFVLLVTAALFLRSIGRAYEMDPGFQTAHLATFMTNPGQAGYGEQQTRAYYRDAREKVARLPGVESAAWSLNLPLWSRTLSGIEVEGREQRSQTDKLRSVVNAVDVDYFAAAGVRLVSGRAFTDADREASAPVAIVNEKLQRDYWPGGALGRRIQLPNEKQARLVVGVARTAYYTTWGEAPQLCVYVPMEQRYSDAMTLFVRSKGDPQALLVPVEREMRAAGPEIIVSDKRTGSEIVYGGLFQARVGVGLLTVFGLLALGLASIGLYGILAYSVAQRRREIGLRMALGASQGTVLGLILKEGMSLVLAGIGIGLAASLVAGRVLSRMLYGVSASDPLSVAGAAVMLTAVALVACYLPARWAARVDPLAALREG
jgi:predicted permease